MEKKANKNYSKQAQASPAIFQNCEYSQKWETERQKWLLKEQFNDTTVLREGRATEASQVSKKHNLFDINESDISQTNKSEASVDIDEEDFSRNALILGGIPCPDRPDHIEEFLEFPHGDQDKIDEIKDVLQAYRGPYPRFGGYYKLEDIIDQYMYMWFEDTTSSD